MMIGPAAQAAPAIAKPTELNEIMPMSSVSGE
jgi:hypothetical protein